MVITAAASGEYIRYNGSNWVDATIDLGDLPGGILLQDGSTELTANWDAGAYTITAQDLVSDDSITAGGDIDATGTITGEDLVSNASLTVGTTAGITGTCTAAKFIAQHTAMSSYDTTDFGFDIITTGDDLTNVYRGVYVDGDYELDTGHVGTAYVIGAGIDVNANGSGIYGSRRIYGIMANTGVDGQTVPTFDAGTAPVGVASNTIANYAGPVYGAYTQATQVSATGVACGYFGYGKNTHVGATGLRAIGLYGYAKASSGVEVGVYGLPFTQDADGFSIYAVGHSHFRSGVNYFYTSTAIQTAVNKTHITTTDLGSVWIEKYLEVDNTAYFDGELHHTGSASKIGFFGQTPASRTTAYTQTYSTATRTHSNPTAAALTDSTTGSADQTLQDTGDATTNDNFADLADEVNKLIADLANVKQLLNQVIDDQQTYGFFQ